MYGQNRKALASLQLGGQPASCLLSEGACNLICHHAGISWVGILSLLLNLDYTVAQLGNLTPLLQTLSGAWKQPSGAFTMSPRRQMSISTGHKACLPAHGKTRRTSRRASKQLHHQPALHWDHIHLSFSRPAV